MRDYAKQNYLNSKPVIPYILQLILAVLAFIILLKILGIDFLPSDLIGGVEV